MPEKKTSASNVTTVGVTGAPPTPVLCSAVYRADQVPGAVIITAQGFHNTSGYKVFFRKSPIDIFPPQFSLWHIGPTGVVLQVITAFSESVQFKSATSVKSVTIVDAHGPHDVPVIPSPDRLEAHALSTFKKDGPFP